MFPTSGHGELPAPCVSCRVQTITPTWPRSNTRRNGALSQVASGRKCRGFFFLFFFSIYDSGSVKECARTEYYCLTTRRAIVGDRKEEEGGGRRRNSGGRYGQLATVSLTTAYTHCSRTHPETLSQNNSLSGISPTAQPSPSPWRGLSQN